MFYYYRVTFVTENKHRTKEGVVMGLKKRAKSLIEGE